jgi:hypothetical protein
MTKPVLACGNAVMDTTRTIEIAGSPAKPLVLFVIGAVMAGRRGLRQHASVLT